MTFLYLLLGHLLSDFVFQTDKIIAWKHKNRTGGIFHSAIHFFVYTAIFLPIIWNTSANLTFLVLALLHFVIDQKKITWEQKTHRYVKAFFIDQGIHVVILGLASFFINRFSFYGEDVASYVTTNRFVIVYLILAIILSYCVEIVHFQFEREKQPHLRFKPDFWAIFKRLFIFSLGYGIFMILSFHEVAKTLLF